MGPIGLISIYETGNFGWNRHNKKSGSSDPLFLLLMLSGFTASRLPWRRFRGRRLGPGLRLLDFPG